MYPFRCYIDTDTFGNHESSELFIPQLNQELFRLDLTDMRFVFILAAALFRFTLFAHTQRIYKAPEPETGPKPATEDNPSGATNEGSQYQGEAIGIPGALAVGKNSKPAPDDDEIDFEDIADALKELVEKIVDALDDSQGVTQSTTTPTITQAPIPTSATPCTDALDAYSSCSTAYNGTFSAIAATVQAGCLCNANPGFDFNDKIGKCYSYAQNRTQLRTYASVIASATAACSCQPNTVFNLAGMGDVGGCTPTNAPAAGTTSTSTGGGSGGGTSPVAASPTPSAAVRRLRTYLGVVVVAAVLGFMSILI